MTAGGILRVAAVLDGTGPAAARHARALGGFLREGLAPVDGVETVAVTHLFAAEEAADSLVLTAPTIDVRLVRVRQPHGDITGPVLDVLEADGGSDLFIFPAGAAGTGLASRLAARAGGSVVTGVLSAAIADDSLTCRRTAYAGHLSGESAAGPRPWCLVLDPGWDDASFEPPEEHAVGAEDRFTADASSAPPALLDLEPLERQQTGDLETAKLLVVAGRGAGSRGGVERLAAAAARMGAAFGVTRPVVMNAWATPDRQVGVSGTRTAPAICIVAGASGAPGFLWGVERAGFIAAVDIDERAPIAGEADAFVAGDAVAVVEALADLLD